MPNDIVNSTNTAYNEMKQKWHLLDDLMGGTQTMRDAGTTWMFKHPRESQTSYDSRIKNSFLFEAYKEAVNDIVAKPFSKDIVIKGELPDRLLDIADNIDLRGSTLTQFARKMFQEGVHRGLVHVLVDFPQTNGQLNLAEERGLGIRPFFVLIPASNMLGWQTAVTANGKIVVTQIRFREWREESVGQYATQMVEYIRVINIGFWELWRKASDNKSSKDEFVRVDSGLYTFNGIPLTTTYLNRSAFMKADPSLEGLAWQNLAHWNSDSDRRNVLKFASVGLLFISGISDEEKEQEIIIGPNQTIKTNSADSDAKYVEYTGNALDGGRQLVLDIEARMKAMGLKPFLQKESGTQTATEKAIDTAQSNSQIQAWIRAVESGVENSFSHAHQWLDLEEDPNFGLDIFNDFGIAMDTAELEQLLKARMSGQISHATYLEEIKRRALLKDDLDIEDEVAAVELEMEAIGAEDDDDN